MKLRLLPMIISLVTSASVLFGGWFLYHSVAMENPLHEMVKNAEGVEEARIDITNDTVFVTLHLSQEANLRNIVRIIRSEGSSIISQRELDIEIQNSSNPELEEWWSHILFDVAQAMETRKYSDIPTILKQQQDQLKGLQIDASMDKQNVYVRLVQGDDSKFIILPRIPVQMEVWANEQIQ